MNYFKNVRDHYAAIAFLSWFSVYTLADHQFWELPNDIANKNYVRIVCSIFYLVFTGFFLSKKLLFCQQNNLNKLNFLDIAYIILIFAIAVIFGADYSNMKNDELIHSSNVYTLIFFVIYSIIAYRINKNLIDEIR